MRPKLKLQHTVSLAIVWAGFTAGSLVAYASDPYEEQIKKMYGFKTGTIDSMDWVLAIGGVLATLTCVYLFVYWFIKLIARLYAIRAGLAPLKDDGYWKRMGFALLIIILFMSGAIFTIMENWWVFYHQFKRS